MKKKARKTNCKEQTGSQMVPIQFLSVPLIQRDINETRRVKKIAGGSVRSNHWKSEYRIVATRTLEGTILDPTSLRNLVKCFGHN